MEKIKDDFYISTDNTKLDVDLIHHFLSTHAYWCKGISKERVQSAIDNSLNFGVYFKEKQIGYARIISDFSTIAYLGDVFILPEYRGKGFSKMLMNEIMNYPTLQGLRRWILLTGDAHDLYKQFGWTAIASPEKWMELHNKDVYSK